MMSECKGYYLTLPSPVSEFYFYYESLNFMDSLPPPDSDILNGCPLLTIEDFEIYS